MTDSEIKAALKKLPKWQQADNAIVRSFEFKDYLIMSGAA
mgnify:CR=1 FL=1